MAESSLVFIAFALIINYVSIFFTGIREKQKTGFHYWSIIGILFFIVWLVTVYLIVFRLIPISHAVNIDITAEGLYLKLISILGLSLGLIAIGFRKKKFNRKSNSYFYIMFTVATLIALSTLYLLDVTLIKSIITLASVSA